MNQTAELIDPSNKHLFARLIFIWIRSPIQIPACPYKSLWQKDAGGSKEVGTEWSRERVTAFFSNSTGLTHLLKYSFNEDRYKKVINHLYLPHVIC